jgi:hypothetical protein
MQRSLDKRDSTYWFLSWCEPHHYCAYVSYKFFGMYYPAKRFWCCSMHEFFLLKQPVWFLQWTCRSFFACEYIGCTFSVSRTICLYWSFSVFSLFTTYLLTFASSPF